IETGLRSEILVFQGDGDRAEDTGSLERHFDQASVARDPYMGAAWLNDWYPSPNLRSSLMLGFLESAIDPEGLKNESFGAVSLGWDLPVSGRWVKLLFAFRYSKEKWRVETIKHEDL